MLTFVVYLFTLHLLISATTMGGESAAYTPTDYILLSCGAPSSFSISEDGRKWVTDEGSKFSAFNSNNISFAAKASRQDQFVTQVPYMNARIFHDEFTYSFPVSAGLKFLRFYFYPVQYSGFDASASFFSVYANDYLLLYNFSAGDVSLIKEFMVPCFETEKLNVTFLPWSNSLAFVNGIEVVSMPNNMYINHQVNSLSIFVGSGIPFDIPDATAFETVYRLNVGGAAVANVDDTGMFRTWSNDSNYIFGTTPSRPNIKIKYSQDTPPYTAPAIVYTTLRTMGGDPKINVNYNLTWSFPIETGFIYLLRLHFCETQVQVSEVGDRVFEIFINNDTAERYADVIYWSGGNNIPVYRDYVLLIPSEGQSKEILWLALHPIKYTSKFADVILNGLEIFRLNNSDGSLAMSMPNPKARSSLTPPKKGRKFLLPMKTIIGAALGCTATLSLSLLLPFVLWRKKRLSFSKRKALPDQRIASPSPLPNRLCECFTLAEIQATTGNFDDAFVIGRGGFGNVYKGFITGLKCEVAIKRLNSISQQGAREFWTEIQLLSQLRHVHLVSLIGYCNSNNEMILVYEYMANGTLRDHLYNTEKTPLSWKQRLEICIGAAHGLDYLHSGAVQRIIHRDVKSTNILLDDKYVAKVSDFGLSKMSPISSTNVPLTTVVKGTFGYMDPEYFKRQQLTEKSDVYSFGVVLFEVLFARPAVDSKLEYSQIGLAGWARKCVENESIGETMDPFLKGKVSPRCLRTYAKIAENCIREKGCERPSMNDVAQRLQFALQLQEIEDAEQIRQASDEA
ncbi:FERONIA [Hibiscus trionum]|uniref:FERONIA n=1 Tax=Hibiscus trionum TaxID=183268 RepID=A0A9W7HG84_HIBTR|nr:FERONIA [Hibiscus trionum]